MHLRDNIPALDGIRGLAILLVMADRFAYFAYGRGSTVDNLIIHAMGTGWVGVQLFFVLSGFLITDILLSTRGSENYFRAFYARRVLRIFPLYYAFLLVVLVLGLFHVTEQSATDQLWAWLFLMNWTGPFGGMLPLGPHLWSLSVEEQFYLFWPLLVSQLRVERLAWLCAGLAVVALAIRVAFWEALGPASADINYVFTICRMDALAIGAGAAALMHIPRARAFLDRNLRAIAWGAAAIFVAGLLVTRGYGRTTYMGQTIGYTVLALDFGVLVLSAALLNGRPGALLNSLFSFAPLRSIGKYSYAMYIFHAPLHLLVGRPVLISLGLYDAQVLWQNLLYAVIASGVTYAMAVVSYHLLEKHFLRLKPPYIYPAGARGSPHGAPA